MFVAGQQLTSLSPPKKPDVSVGFFAVKREILCNQNMIARGCAAELSVARSLCLIIENVRHLCL